MRRTNTHTCGHPLALMAVALSMACLFAAAPLMRSVRGTIESKNGKVSFANTEGVAPSEIFEIVDAARFWSIDLSPPKDYYAGVDDSTAEALRKTLHLTIDNHTVFPYTTKSLPRDSNYKVDTWGIIALADEFAHDSSNVIDIYKNEVYAKQYTGAEPRAYDREHSWPKSYGFSKKQNGKNADTKTNPAWSDCHHLYVCFDSYNSKRGNTYFASPDGSSTPLAFPTIKNLGRGGDSADLKESANWRRGPSSESGSWEVWYGRRGDIARAMFYMDVRYEGKRWDTPSGTKEADLTLTSNPSEIKMDNSTKKAWLTFAVVKFGLLDDLLEWHKADPVDDFERRRNAIVSFFQRNRNPFVDHPEWVDVVYAQN